jgi:hypothetical protein
MEKQNFSTTEVKWRDLSDGEIDEFLASFNLIEKLKVLQDNSPNMWRYSEYLYKKYKAELMTSYMNARVTCSQSLGNKKTERNRSICEYYKNAMIDLEIPIPADNICWVLGVFNGLGSV